MTDVAPVWRRRAARLLLVDEAGTHVLLVQGFDPRRPQNHYWFTVGGGIDEGEDAMAAIVREAMEEIGYAVVPADVVGPFRPEQVEFSFDGTSIVQDQEYYVVVTPRFDPMFVGVDDVERDSTVTVAWVPLRGIPDLAEPVHPPHLAEIVAEWRTGLTT
ncbi:NUDIX domain-containing protein [Lapillicoccus sp.]|uniref:NUDIX hydrolase n=1 Tax=Lapillicoccus sp. TaxID=1909287 RepID=UPI0025CE7486|nr:NUDIX domain-containing protein [Lapillicoccus sp.]